MNSKKQGPSKEAANEKPECRTTKGPEPERLKITGYANCQDAAAALVRAKRPPGGWPK
jgi:hypothetical protein